MHIADVLSCLPPRAWRLSCQLAQGVMEALVESRFLSLERLLAFFVSEWGPGSAALQALPPPHARAIGPLPSALPFGDVMSYCVDRCVVHA